MTLRVSVGELKSQGAYLRNGQWFKSIYDQQNITSLSKIYNYNFNVLL